MKQSVPMRPAPVNPTVDAPLLITTKTCPACRVTTAWLDKKGVAYTKVYADQDPEVAEQYGVKSVPVMVVILPDGEERQLSGFHEIRAHFS